MVVGTNTWHANMNWGAERSRQRKTFILVLQKTHVMTLKVDFHFLFHQNIVNSLVFSFFFHKPLLSPGVKYRVVLPLLCCGIREGRIHWFKECGCSLTISMSFIDSGVIMLIKWIQVRATVSALTQRSAMYNSSVWHLQYRLLVQCDIFSSTVHKRDYVWLLIIYDNLNTDRWTNNRCFSVWSAEQS